MIVHKTFMDDDGLRPSPREEVVHRATCDLCGSSIRGVRFVSLPGSF